MGGVVSLLQATARPESVAGVVLVNPRLARPLGIALDRRVETMFGRWLLPGLGERALARRWRRLAPADVVAETLGLCCVDRSRVPAETVDALGQARGARPRGAELAPGLSGGAALAAATAGRPGASSRCAPR